MLVLCGREILSGPGTSSDQPSQSPGQDRRPAAQPSVQRKIRVTNLYATPWQLPEQVTTGELSDYLELWRFEQYYRLSADLWGARSLPAL